MLAVVKVLDMAFFEALGRPFNPATDRTYVGPAVDFVSDEIGHGTAIAALIGLVLLALLVLVALPLSVLRLTRLADRHRGTSLRVVVAVGVVWLLCAVSGAQIVPGAPIASTSATGLAYEHVSEVHSTIEDRQVFAEADGGRPLREHTRRRAADRPARQGRPARVRRELRADRGRGLRPLGGRQPGPGRRDRPARVRPGSPPAAPS